jgi:hypothetical protein
MKKALEYMAALIALYLGVNYATGASADFKSGSTGVATIVESLQGKG